MPEPVSSFERQYAEERKQRVTWLSLVGMLFLALIVVWGVGRNAINQQEKAFKSILVGMDETRTREIKQAVEIKGITVVRSFQMANADLLTDKGQKDAQEFFGQLLKDRNLAFVVLLDADGVVRATTDLRFAREKNDVSDIRRITVKKQAANGADMEVLGPITDTNGKRIGVVRVGLLYKVDEAKKE